MADNTVAEAVETLNNLPFASRETTICFGKPAMVIIEHRKIDTDDAHAIAALIEQQAAEIERLNQTWPNSCDFKDDDGCCLFPGAMTPECHADVCGVIRDLKQEVVRKNRVIYVACQRLARRSDGYYGVENWLAWLEKEAEGEAE